MKTLALSQASTALDKLDQFTGTWQTKGKVLSGDRDPEMVLAGTDTYEWLPGGFFMLHKVDVTIGGEKVITWEIIGYDQAARHYTLQHYDNKGNSGFMTASLNDGLWSILGEKLRFNGRFSKDTKVFSGVWEQLKVGEDWKEYMDVTLSKTA